MNIAIVGTGYVGLVTGACLAAASNYVTCIDKNPSRVLDLRAGKIPFYEPGLSELVAQARQKKMLQFTAKLADGVKSADMVFLAVGTPPDDEGRTDLSGLLACVRDLSPLLQRDTIVVIKSTVPPGTCEHVQEVLDNAIPAGSTRTIHVVSNPEFLAEGRAVDDFQRPARIVIGTSHRRTQQALLQLYAPFTAAGGEILLMDTRSAEFAKYACNAMLAARISMVNELAGIAGQVNADVESVCQVMGLDPRIGPQYLQPGAGYGGSCLPKDVASLIRTAQDTDEPAYMLRSVERVNHRQGRLLFESLSAHFSHLLRGRCLAIWGLAFKPGTDDVRNAPSLNLIQSLVAAGARVQAYDPVAAENTRAAIDNQRVMFAHTAHAACEGADALVVMTEWEEFRDPDFALLAKQLSTAAIFDARGIYDAAQLQRHGLRHYPLQQKRPVLRHTLSELMPDILPFGRSGTHLSGAARGTSKFSH